MIDFLSDYPEYEGLERDKENLLIKELKHWKIPLPQKLMVKQIQQKLFNIAPSNVPMQVIEKWRQLPPFDI